ncbi:MAG: hypothetical protein H0Z40_05895 [Desulfotomaculum sp.]|nr:hypothetical protein [Desulfotomaculum sp.]
MYKINLLPRDLQGRPHFIISRLVGIALITLFICIAAASYGGFLSKLKMKREELKELKMELASAAPAVGKLNSARNDNTEQQKKLIQLQSLLQKNINWYELLEDINYSTPKDISLTRIELTRIEIFQQAPGKGTGVKEQQASGIDSLVGYEYKQHETAGKDKNNENNKKDKKVLILKGAGTSLSSVGLFIFKLQQLPYFDEVILKTARREEHDSPLMLFNIYAFLLEEEGSE